MNSTAARDTLQQRNEADARHSRRVSRRSEWADKVWFLDSELKNLHASFCSVKWDFDMPDGSAFVDSRWELLREELRCFVWSLLKAPQEGLPKKAQTLHRHSFIWRPLVRWMAEHDFTDLCQLTNSASWNFLSDYVIEIEKDGRELSVSAVRTAVSVLQLLWTQKPYMEKEGYGSLPEAPLDGLSGSELARRLNAKIDERVQPVPEEVALSILNAAHRWIGPMANDVIRLAEDHFSWRYSDRSRNAQSRIRSTRLSMLKWKSSILIGDTKPWLTIKERQEELSWDGNLFKPRVRNLNVGRKVSATIDDLRDACIHVIQSESGVRISEMGSFQSGIGEASQLPSCISIRTSQTGLNDLFFLRGTTYKLRPMPEETEWLIGMRPRGSDYIPPPVRAVQILERLYRPWRQCEGAPEEVRTSLLLSFVQLGFRPFDEPASAVAPMQLHSIRDAQREFIVRNVDLASLPATSARGEDLSAYNDTMGGCVAPRQWRKNFAQYLWRVDSRMAPAIAQQFKHLSLAMTEEAYIGNDIVLLKDINSARTQKTVELFRAWSKNDQASAGFFSGRLREHRRQIAVLVEGKSEEEATSAIRDYVVTNDLRIWFSDHGHCFIGLNPDGAKCHEKAGTSSWSNQAPNVATREPSVCAGCSHYYVDHDHRDYWQRRLDAHEVLALASKRVGEKPPRVVQLRLAQARSVLRRISIQMEHT